MIGSKYERFLNWLIDHFAIIQLTFLAIPILIGLVTSLVKRSFAGDEMIVSLLILLCLDMVIFSLGYLETIKNNSTYVHDLVKEVHKTTSSGSLLLNKIVSNDTLLNDKIASYGHLFPETKRCLVSGLETEIINLLSLYEKVALDEKLKCVLDKPNNLDVIQNAQQNIFISGTGMTFIQNNIGSIKAIMDGNKGLHMTLVVSDYENINVQNYMKGFFGKSDDYFSTRKKIFHDESFVTLTNKKEIFDRVDVFKTDTFIPIAFVAADYKIGQENLSHSVIYAKHYLLSEKGEATNAFWHRAFPGTKLFETYQAQILLIEGSRGELAIRYSSEAKKD